MTICLQNNTFKQHLFDTLALWKFLPMNRNNFITNAFTLSDFQLG